jgi:signal peptidase I
MPEGDDTTPSAPIEPSQPAEPTLAAGSEGSEHVASQPRETRTPAQLRTRVVLEWVAVAVAALLVAFLVRTYVVQTFYIPSASMEPTLQIGDRIIVSKLSYDFHAVHRGDIVVFHAPPKESTVCADPEVKDLVKRVIGLPGETISSRGNTVLINGKPLAEPWFPAVDLGPPIRTQVIPKDQYFVMGDNRPNSCDSRMWGTLPGANIIGHVVLRVWPLSRIGIP